MSSNTTPSIDLRRCLSYVCVAMFRHNLISGQSAVQEAYDMSKIVTLSKVNSELEESDVLICEDISRVGGTHAQWPS